MSTQHSIPLGQFISFLSYGIFVVASAFNAAQLKCMGDGEPTEASVEKARVLRNLFLGSALFFAILSQ